MSITPQMLSENTCTPQRDSNIALIADWVKQPALSVTHNNDYSLVRFPSCPNRPDTTDGGFAVKVFDNFALPVCFHDKCVGHDWESTLGPCPLQEQPWYTSAVDFVEQYAENRAAVIDGVLSQGDTMNVIAPTKLGKSFFVMQLALSVAAGMEWFGYSTVKGKVLIIDNELHRDTIRQRLESVREAMGLDKSVLKNVEIAALRGQLVSLDELCRRVKRLPKNQFSLVVCDAFYRMLPKGTDENGNADMMHLYNTLDSAAASQGCAIALVHHTSKGDQSKKSVTDVGSGAGSQSRAADCHLVLRPHSSLGCVTMQAAVRANPAIQPIVLRREHPLWLVATDADPTQLRTSRVAFTLEQFNEWLAVGEYVVNELRDRLRTEKELTKEQATSLINDAFKHGSLELVDGPANQKRKAIKI